MVFSSGEEEPKGRSAGIAILVGVALVLGGTAFWHFTREAPGRATPSARPSPGAAPAPTPRSSVPASAGAGSVAITASVEGTTVFVDGRKLGPAPQRIDLDAGSHKVRVEKEGFETFEREVHIVPGRTLELEARLVVPGPRLSVSADVPGAQVFLDRRFVGEAPVVIRDVAPGGHRLNVSAEGYPGYAGDIEVGPGVSAIQVRFKEVRLDESLAVRHKHGLGSCEGRLGATIAGLRYVTDNEKDSFTLPFASLEPLEVDYLGKNLRVKVPGGRTFNFTADHADDLLRFQRAVESARVRLP